MQVADVRFLREHTDRTIKVTVPGPFTMSQQAQDDYYGSPEQLADAYADAVNAEVRDLFAAGADIVQLDEPYLQARPEPARAYGVKALNRALDGVVGTTAVHLCFGYAAIIHERPSGYSFLPELADCSCDQISIETAQSNLDTSVLTHLAGKKIMLGVIDLSTAAVESVDTVAERVRRALPYVAPENVIIATDCGMKYLPRERPRARCGPWRAPPRCCGPNSVADRSAVGDRTEPHRSVRPVAGSSLPGPPRPGVCHDIDA